MHIGEAIQAAKAGQRITRPGWNGKGMWLRYIPGSEGDGWTCPLDVSPRPLLPFLVMNTADQCLVPWLASQTDLLADDWEILED